MTHNFQRGNWMEEAAITMGTGVVYGAVNTMVGHPLDTVKTRMQTIDARQGGIIETSRFLWKNDGLRGFYRGCIPPLWGSIVYRSAQFTVFEAAYTKLSEFDALTKPTILNVFEPRVLIAGFVASSIRGILESPIEYAKIQGQTGQKWRFGDVYQGFQLQWLRTAPFMTTYFVTVDYLRKNTNLMDYRAGQFLLSGGAAAFGLMLVWPLETMKNRAQAGTVQTSNWFVDAKKLGVSGLYRGMVAGLGSVFLRNGAAMVVMQELNRAIRTYREKINA